MKLLQIALEKQNYTLAAHVLVYGLIKAKRDGSCNGKKSKRQRKE
jgi:hypothetical protein